jgi:hypothetical protein
VFLSCRFLFSMLISSLVLQVLLLLAFPSWPRLEGSRPRALLLLLRPWVPLLLMRREPVRRRLRMGKTWIREVPVRMRRRRHESRLVWRRLRPSLVPGPSVLMVYMDSQSGCVGSLRLTFSITVMRHAYHLTTRSTHEITTPSLTCRTA